MNEYDRVEIRAENIVFVTTIGTADGTLVRDWTDDDERSYKSAT